MLRRWAIKRQTEFSAPHSTGLRKAANFHLLYRVGERAHIYLYARAHEGHVGICIAYLYNYFPPKKKKGVKRPVTHLKQDRLKNHEVKHLSNLEASNSLSSIMPWKQLQRAKYCSPSPSTSPLEVTGRLAQLRAAEFGPSLAIYVLRGLFLQQRLACMRSRCCREPSCSPAAQLPEPGDQKATALCLSISTQTR